MPKFVYDFAEGNRDLRDLLGGKGAAITAGVSASPGAAVGQAVFDTAARTFTTPAGLTIREGDVISIDGTSGAVYRGEAGVKPSPVVRYFEGELSPDSAEAGELIRAVHRIMTHADARRRLGVLANADSSQDAARARRFGAEGIGLVRTEHMFLGERRQLVENLILAETDDDREQALGALETRPWTAFP